MIKTFKDFWAFLKNPYLLKFSKDKVTLKQDFFWLLLLDIAFALVLSLIFYVLLELKLIKEYKYIDLIKEYGIYWSLIIGVVLGPVVEECVFRWHLRRLSASVYFVFLSTAGLIISFITNTWVCFLIFFLCLSLAIITEIYLRKQSQTRKQLVWKRIFPFVFFFSALVFGFVHLHNFDELTIKVPVFVIYISSQTFGGLTLGYLRIKYGLKYSMLFHGGFNLFALILSILFPNF